MKLTINELKLIKNKVKGTVTWDEIEAMAAQILKDQEALEKIFKLKTSEHKYCVGYDIAKAALLPKE